MSTDAHVAQAARAYAESQLAVEQVDSAGLLTAIIVRDLWWRVLLERLELLTPDDGDIVDTAPL